MKTFKAVQEFNSGEPMQDLESFVINLVNIDDENDVIMSAPDEFKIGEIVSEENIILKECNYVDEQGSGTGLFAFKVVKGNRYYRCEFTDFEWFDLMNKFGEDLPTEYCDIFDRDGEVGEEYADLFNVDVYIKE
jgi:hypothetical protein